MNKTFKLTALLMALVLCVSFAACGKKAETQTTTAAPETTAPVETDATAQPVDATVDASQPITVEESSVSETSAAANEATTGAAATTAAAGVAQPANTAEIVALFNNSANAVRKDKPGFTCHTTNYVNKITCESSALQRIADTALNFIKADPTSETVAKGASHNTFGASSTSYASALQVGSVSSATCTKSGNSYKIKINLKSEKLADLPKDASKTNTGKAMLVLGAKDVYEQTDKIPGVNITKFAPTYSGCYIDATVNATTGKLTSCTYFWHSVNDVQAKVIGMTAGAVVDFGIKRVYALKY